MSPEDGLERHRAPAGPPQAEFRSTEIHDLFAAIAADLTVLARGPDPAPRLARKLQRTLDEIRRVLCSAPVPRG